MTVSLPDHQAVRLAEVCREQNISRAEAVRRAVARSLEELPGISRNEVFGMWRDRDCDSLGVQRRMRREWS